MEFSTLNGYKVKDKKAIRSYDTVALMKADTTLKEGQHVKTKGYYEVGDGGHGEYIIVNDSTLTDDNGTIFELSNGLYGKLIISNEINAKQFDTLENAITFSKNNTDIKMIVNDNIEISSTLSINANQNIEFKDITYTGTEYAIEINDGLSGNIKFGNINSSNGNGINFNPTSTYVGRLNLNFKNITCSGNALNFENSEGIFDCNINGIVITSSTGYGINMAPDNSYIGQINYNITRIESTDNYAINIDTTNGGFTGSNFNYLSLEGSKNGINCTLTLNKSFESIYGKFRVFEMTGTVLKITGDITNATADSHLYFDKLKYNQIDVSQITYQTLSSHGFYIYGKITANDSNNELASKGVIRRNYFALTEYPSQYQRLTATNTAWNGDYRPITHYQVETADTIVLNVPSYICPESNKRFFITLAQSTYKNVTLRSPSNEWITDLSTQTITNGQTYEVVSSYNGTNLSYFLLDLGVPIRRIIP